MMLNAARSATTRNLNPEHSNPTLLPGFNASPKGMPQRASTPALKAT